MKYLRNFSSVSEANTLGANGLDSPHVSIVDGKTAVNIYSASTETFTCSFDSNGKIQNVTPVSTGHELGDICYWDGSKLAFIPYTSWQSSLGTALAVCFIPTSHAKVWGDGKARFISVKGVNADGTASTTHVQLYWDSISKSRDAGLTKYTKVPIWNNTTGGSVSSNDGGYLSGDAFLETGDEPEQNVIDTSTYFFYGDKDSYTFTPYDADGSFNADYIRTIEGNNALSDFNGKVNTTTIVSVLGSEGGQAAKACSLYSTNGTAAGEWYLPACGELAYIVPRFNVINSALTACGGVLIDNSGYYWSSSEYNSNNAYYVGTDDGSIDYNPKVVYAYVCPVLALS